MQNSTDMVRARLHLGAVLPRIAEVAARDKAAQDIIRGWNMVTQFQLPGGDPATALIFKDGKLTAQPGDYGGAKVTLTFPDAPTLNAVFQGKSKQQPRPSVNAVFHASKLKKLDGLLARLDYYLRPSAEMLKDPEQFAFVVELTLTVLTCGLKYVGENDREARPVVAHMPEGTLEIRVPGGPTTHIEHRAGKFNPAKGSAARPNAILELRDMDTAWRMLQNKVDFFAAVGLGEVRLKGSIALLDPISLLMDRLDIYLNPK
ncbi:MAG TPA: hypothetical protein PL033_06905 [Candidatus Brocadiia bacterium]|nr:hypothetical protein [Candidatus Brocadiia bacterium]